jgi:hypothetical protein
MHSVEKIRDEVKAAVKNTIQKRSYSKKPHEGKQQEQRQACQTLRSRYLGSTTLPNRILDNAINFSGESLSSARKKMIEPRDSKVRLSRWRDIVQSDIFFKLWTEAWTSQSNDPVIENPFPPHQPMYDYSRLLTRSQINNDGTNTSNQGHPVDCEEATQDETKCLRTCSATFNCVIREEHCKSGEDLAILRTIESTQMVMTAMTNEMYTLAHMAALLVSGCRSECCAEHNGMAWYLIPGSFFINCTKGSTHCS